MIQTTVTTPRTKLYNLSNDELINPHLVIADLFSSYPHEKIKELMWEW